MIKCNKCGATIKELYTMPIETFYGVSNDFNYSSNEFVELCPYCESADLVYVDEEEIYDLWESDRNE